MHALDAKIGELWGLGGESSEELKESVMYLSNQDLRTSTKEHSENQVVIDDLKTWSWGWGAEGIQYISEGDMSVEEFNERFVCPSQPCMILGCSDEWKAKDQWDTPANLSKHHGNIPIRITERKDHPSAMAKPLRVPLRHYCSYAEADSGGADFPWYAPLLTRTNARTHTHTRQELAHQSIIVSCRQVLVRR